MRSHDLPTQKVLATYLISPISQLCAFRVSHFSAEPLATARESEWIHTFGHLSFQAKYTVTLTARGTAPGKIFLPRCPEGWGGRLQLPPSVSFQGRLQSADDLPGNPT